MIELTAVRRRASRSYRLGMSGLLFLGAPLGCAAIVGADFEGAHLRPTASAGGTGAEDAGPLPPPGVGGSQSPERPPPRSSNAGGAGSGGVASEAPEVPLGGDGAGGSAPIPDTGLDAGMDAGLSTLDAGSCTEPAWQRLDSFQPTNPRAIPAATLANSLGVVRDVTGTPKCAGVLVSISYLLVVDCALSVSDRVEFSAWADATPGTLPVTSSHALAAVFDIGEHHAMAQLATAVSYVPWQNVPMDARLPGATEPLTLISYDDDGMPRAATTILAPELFDAPGALAAQNAAFSSSGSLLGFCALSCLERASCVSLASLAKTSASLRSAVALQRLLWADSTGDGRADATVVNWDQVWLSRSNGFTLQAPESWVPAASYGSRQNLLADANGDGNADLVVVNESETITLLSSGQGYTWPGLVTSAFYGRAGTMTGNVDGVAGDDLVVIADDSLIVRRASAAGFAENEHWASGVEPDPVRFVLADVTGDGKADAVSWGRGTRVEVRASNGSGFDPPQTWLEGAVAERIGWYFADVTGDGKVDAVLVDLSGSAVFPSGGTRFAQASTPWQPELPLGERGNAFADVSGDGKADAIVHHNRGVFVYLSTGAGFLPPVQWVNGPFYGGP
jgi:hypothetical protein